MTAPKGERAGFRGVSTSTPNPTLPLKGRAPVSPITTNGWYEHTDGTVGYWSWGGDPSQPRISDCRERVPTKADLAAEQDEEDA